MTKLPKNLQAKMEERIEEISNRKVNWAKDVAIREVYKYSANAAAQAMYDELMPLIEKAIIELKCMCYCEPYDPESKCGTCEEVDEINEMLEGIND